MDASLRIFSHQRLPVIHQTEAAECGLACLAMIASWHGHRIDLAALRLRHAISLKGTTLPELMRIATGLHLAPRAVRLELDDLTQLKLPAILHWDMNHFVVLRERRHDSVIVHDPARGERTLKLDEFTKHFTGVALELAPTTDFRPKDTRRRLRLRDLWGDAHGVLRGLAQVFALSLALQLVMLASPWFLQLVVDHVLLSADANFLAVLGIGFGLLVLMRTAIAALRAWMIEYLSVNLGFQVLSNLFRHMLTLPMEFFLKRHVGDIVSRLTSADVIQRTLTTTFIEALVDGALVLITLIVMYVYSPLLATVAVIAAALYTLVRCAAYRPLREATEEQIVRDACKDSNLLETIRGAQSVRLFGREAQRHGLWQNLLAEKLNADVRIAKLNIGFGAANQVLFGLEHVVIVWLGALAVTDSQLSTGMLLAFLAYRGQFSEAAGSLVDKFVEYRMLDLHLERVGDIALSEPENISIAQSALRGNDNLSGRLQLENVSFRYASGEPCVLDNISLDVRPSESVAITGPSGCGKTTLMRVMLGLLRPTEGRVLVDGLDVHGSGSATREVMASVMQEDHLFAGSLAQNICFFDEQPDLEKIVQCAMLAAIHDEIVAMPMGYETLVGDMGTTLSGGQKQRVLLARALYRQPKLLFLDEATSHLDIDREQLVNAAVAQLNITRIIIAHREETIRSADRVVCLGEPNSCTGRKRESMETAGSESLRW